MNENNKIKEWEYNEGKQAVATAVAHEKKIRGQMT